MHSSRVVVLICTLRDTVQFPDVKSAGELIHGFVDVRDWENTGCIVKLHKYQPLIDVVKRRGENDWNY
jgi:hypothetical protein